MIYDLLSIVTNFIINTISRGGYIGVGGLMAIESANIPLPSEIIMPFAGFLVSTGQLNLWWVALAGAVGGTIGSIVSYWLGVWGGRPLIEKYGKYIFISHHDLDLADRWFAKYGEATVFFTRLMPIIRTFISFPAGIAKMHFVKFVIYSFIGSYPWTLALAFIGQKLGENWESIKTYFRGFDWVILILIILAIIWWIKRHIQNQKSSV